MPWIKGGSVEIMGRRDQRQPITSVLKALGDQSPCREMIRLVCVLSSSVTRAEGTRHRGSTYQSDSENLN